MAHNNYNSQINKNMETSIKYLIQHLYQIASVFMIFAMYTFFNWLAFFDGNFKIKKDDINI